MTETAETTTESTTQVAPNPFAEGAWKPEPTPTPPPVASTEAVVEEKEVVVDDAKTEEVEKVVATTPDPIKVETTEVKVKEEEPKKFANDESEKVYNALIAGDKDKVLEILNEQKKLSSADKLAPADVIKLNLQYQNKDFSPQEINDLFEETYTFPEKPEMTYDETEDDFKKREDKYKAQVEKIENRIKRDAKPATAELLKLSKEIVLPDIQRQAPVNNAPTQEELEAQKVQAEMFIQSVDKGLEVLHGYQVTFKDEEVTIPVTYKMTKEEKDAIRPLVALSNSNAGEFLSKIGWLDANGNINAAKLAEDLPFILDKEKIISKMVSETGNKRHEASIKAIKNIDYSGKKSAGGDVGASPRQLEEAMVNTFFRS